MQFAILSPWLCMFLLDTSRVLETESQDTFSAVTGVDNLYQLYLRMKIREPHIEPDMKINAETKKHICRSIMESAYFKKDDLHAVDMSKIYKKLKFLKTDQKRRPLTLTHVYYSKVLEDYVKISSSQHNTDNDLISMIISMGTRKTYTYRTRLIPFLRHAEAGEFAFACAARRGYKSTDLYLYYISDAYNINATLDEHTDRPTLARFICAANLNSCDLKAIAEEPATVLTTNYAEDVYLQMRQYYDPDGSVSDDPLCALTESEKLRVCASVMNSSHIRSKVIEFYPYPSSLKQDCEFNQVSFRKEDVKDVIHKEWMLTCIGVVQKSKKEVAIVHQYSLSRAYESHHVMVYHYCQDTMKWLIVNISANISVLIDDENTRIIRQEYAGRSPPNLNKILKSLTIKFN